jgi:hypothetical protein
MNRYQKWERGYIGQQILKARINPINIYYRGKLITEYSITDLMLETEKAFYCCITFNNNIANLIVFNNKKEATEWVSKKN